MVEKQQRVNVKALVLFLIAITFVLGAGCSEKRLPMDVFVYKTDSSGTILWTANITNGSQVFIDRIVENTENGNLIAGNKRDFIAEISPAGTVNRTTAPETGSSLYSFTTSDGGKLTFDGSVKIGANGTPEWERDYNYLTIVLQLKNGNYLIDDNEGHPTNASVVCLDQNGSVLWENDVGVELGHQISTMYESPAGMIEITSQYTVWGSIEDLIHRVESRQLTFDREGTFYFREKPHCCRTDCTNI